MEIGSLVRISCKNNFLNGKIGTLVLNEDCSGGIYGTCVMIDGAVYGFEPHEVEKIN